MKAPRVKRSAGPKSAMTKATYRRKALQHLLNDFQGHCAYCLDPKEFRSPSLNHVDHYDCKLRGRERHYYKNLMLACAACNLSKHEKPIVNPLNSSQRMLNCTEENEFTGHIIEKEDGQWEATSDAGYYHLETIELTQDCHKKKRQIRRLMAERVRSLFSTAIQYKTDNPIEVHNEMMSTIRTLMDTLDNFPPLVTEQGVVKAREWLKSKGVDLGKHD